MKKVPKLPTLSLHKVIFQVRYKPHLKFYTLLFPAASQIEEEGLFPHWETNGRTVVLKDIEKRCSIAIDFNSFSYEQDSGDIELEQKHIAKALGVLPSGLEITSYLRIGYRRQYLAPVGMSFSDLVSILNIKFLSQDEKFIKILPSKVEDMMYRVDLAEDPYRFHLTIGPVRKNEIPKWVQFNRRHLPDDNQDVVYHSIVEKYPDVAVFMDIDIYQHKEGIEIEEVASFLEYARRQVHELVEELNAYLFAVMEG